jgi:hypothetical protein
VRYVLRRLEGVKMKVKELKEIIKDMSDDDLVFVALYYKEESEEHIRENLNEGEDFSITNEQWEEVVEKMDRDEGIWSELSGAWRDYLEKVYNSTKKEGVNV